MGVFHAHFADGENRRDPYLHPKAGRRAGAAPGSLQHLREFFSPFPPLPNHPPTHAVLCKQPAELLLRCGSCFSKRGTRFYFLHTLMTRAAAGKQNIRTRHLCSAGVRLRGRNLYPSVRQHSKQIYFVLETPPCNTKGVTPRCKSMYVSQLDKQVVKQLCWD